MQTDIDQINEYFQHLGDKGIGSLRFYYEALVNYNNKVNLISSSTAPNAAKQHFADSLLGLDICFKHSDFADPVYDFGSGNGFPGLVLAIMRPEVTVNIVERDMRKVDFLKHVKSELKLSNTTVIPQTLETIGKESIKLGITRALGTISPVVIQMTSLFQEDGVLFHFKTDSWTTELANCPTQVFTKWDIQSVGHYVLPDSTVDRYIIASRKIS